MYIIVYSIFFDVEINLFVNNIKQIKGGGEKSPPAGLHGRRFYGIFHDFIEKETGI